jgi:parvulin-like peptidyl-prolyl isomerase
MNTTFKMLVLLCAAPCAVWGATAGSAAKTNAQPDKPAVSAGNLFTNEVVARAKGVTITRNELDDEVVRVKTALASQGRNLPPDAMVLERQILDNMIIKELLLAKATEADKARGKEIFEMSLQKFRAQEKLTDEEFNQKLSMQLLLSGMSKDQWMKQNIEQATIPLILEHELKVNVTEADAKKYYDENSASFETPEMVRAAHVLIATHDPLKGEDLSEEDKAAKKKQAEDILKRAKAGEDFAKLAKEYSDDRGSKDKGGEYTFPRGRMTAAFESAAFALETNQVSDIVTTPFGYHVIKLYEKLPAKKETYAGLDTRTVFTMPTGDTATLRDVLADQARQRQLKGYVEQLQKESNVQILDEKLKNVKVPEPEQAPAGAGDPGKTESKKP